MAMGPNTTGRFHTGESHRCVALAYSPLFSGESEPAKSVWSPMNSLIPAPEPLGGEFTDWPGQACSNALTKRVIAFSWAVEPLAFRVGWPPQVTLSDAPLPPVALLLPPHADKITAPTVRTITAAPNLLIFNLIPSMERCDDRRRPSRSPP